MLCGFIEHHATIDKPASICGFSATDSGKLSKHRKEAHTSDSESASGPSGCVSDSRKATLNRNHYVNATHLNPAPIPFVAESTDKSNLSDPAPQAPRQQMPADLEYVEQFFTWFDIPEPRGEPPEKLRDPSVDWDNLKAYFESAARAQESGVPDGDGNEMLHGESNALHLDHKKCANKKPDVPSEPEAFVAAPLPQGATDTKRLSPRLPLPRPTPSGVEPVFTARYEHIHPPALLNNTPMLFDHSKCTTVMIPVSEWSWIPCTY